MDDLKCTIIIPAYNAGLFVERAIASARAQGSTEEVRIIVVDDGSTDDTAARVKAQGMAELVQQPNGGVSAARNAGLALATGEYIIFLDADDELLPDALEHHRNAMEAHPHAVMVFGSNHIITETGEIIRSNETVPYETRDFMRTAMHVTPSPSQAMMRRAAVAAAGGYDPDLKGAEDCDLSLRLLQHGAIVCHGHYVMNYRRHSGQATGRPSKVLQEHMRMLQRRLNDPAAPTDPKDRQQLVRKWQRHYGQFMPLEMTRLTVTGNIGEALKAARHFTSALPASAVGAASFLRQRLFARN
ncbi:glycosyltransferase family 2 protein [Erythrobacter dokdonensis]|uniref:Glycosyl transferase family 2 n=1 Tax=Erythrobacter dokdonensis DSW-74 TaxID=1300349 RepID=A0A1A7BFA7_9SPHN|nr:glycosyltransferase family 2 protein [Erythrobacter dokdonensis]OBV11208.1 Glycosyl transferase family 2 [Erythrobacter dokdonensis DSW-74]